MKEHIYKSQTVVIGGSLDALSYAYKNNFSIIINNVVHAAPYDTVGYESHLGIKADASIPWAVARLKHELAMSGKLMFGPIVDSISVDLDNLQISVSSKYFPQKKMRFGKLIICDQNGVSGMPFNISSRYDNYRVLDWFNIRSGSTTDLDVIIDDKSDFVKKITFSYSKRIKAAKARGQKDMIAESLVRYEDLDDYSHSHSMSRLKSISMINSASPQCEREINLQFVKRKTFPVKRSIYKEEGPIIYKEGSVKEDNI